MTGCGSAWLERLVWDQEVAGSNPVTPILIYARVAQWWSIALPRRGSRVSNPVSRSFYLTQESCNSKVSCVFCIEGGDLCTGRAGYRLDSQMSAINI